MSNSNIKITKQKKRIIRKVLSVQKKALFLTKRRHKNTLPVFIMGCGRSGTTMLLDMFHRDIRIESLGEGDPLIAEKNFMLNYKKLSIAIYYSKAPVMVMKPILNTFDAKHILLTYDTSQVFWVIRDYKDMVASSLIKFGDRVSRFMSELVQNNEGDNWISRGIHPDTLKLLRELDSTGFSASDWMGLVWWSVNRTLIIDNLLKFKRLKLIRYEDFVNSEDNISSLYLNIGLKHDPKKKEATHSKSIGKGSYTEFNPKVDDLCCSLDRSIRTKLKI